MVLESRIIHAIPRREDIPPCLARLYSGAPSRPSFLDKKSKAQRKWGMLRCEMGSPDSFCFLHSAHALRPHLAARPVAPVRPFGTAHSVRKWWWYRRAISKWDRLRVNRAAGRQRGRSGARTFSNLLSENFT